MYVGRAQQGSVSAIVQRGNKMSKYDRECKGVVIDVYDVLKAFNVTDPALQHLTKKALCVGLRGHKSRKEDLQDILDSAIRAVELNKEP